MELPKIEPEVWDSVMANMMEFKKWRDEKDPEWIFPDAGIVQVFTSLALLKYSESLQKSQKEAQNTNYMLLFMSAVLLFFTAFESINNYGISATYFMIIIALILVVYMMIIFRLEFRTR